VEGALKMALHVKLKTCPIPFNQEKWGELLLIWSSAATFVVMAMITKCRTPVACRRQARLKSTTLNSSLLFKRRRRRALELLNFFIK
jgi:hypothetical protein